MHGVFLSCSLSVVSLVRQDSLCSPQLITEDEGLSRLAQTVQVLVELADGSQRTPKQETLSAAASVQ